MKYRLPTKPVREVFGATFFQKGCKSLYHYINYLSGYEYLFNYSFSAEK